MKPIISVINLLIILIAERIIVVSCIPDDMVKHLDLIKKCADKNNMTEDHAIETIETDGEMEAHDDKCFQKCLGEFVGIFDENTGKLIPEKFLEGPPKYFDPIKVPAAVAKCKDVSGADPCDTAYQIVECLMKEIIPAELPES